MTITSGLAQVGKTHLALNLALELVRRGRNAALYHEMAVTASIDAVIDLPRAVTLRRRATDVQAANDFIRRGYLGIDILSSRLPLRDWARTDAAHRADCLDALQSQAAFDDLLIDTSGMEPGSLIAACRASACVVLVLTPDVHSQAEAFALLKVLALNGYAGELWLLVNRAPDAQVAQAVQQRFNTQVQAHLGGEAPLLGSVPEDDRVAVAQGTLQAFSAIFPDCAAAAAILALVDRLPEAQAGTAAQRSVLEFWERFLEIMQEPVHVAGNVLLQEMAAEEAGNRHGGAVPVVATEARLLSLGADLAQLPATLERAAESLQAGAGMLAVLAARLEATPSMPAQAPATPLEAAVLPELAARLLTALAADSAQAGVELQVERVSVSTAADDWLRPGHYLRYVLQLTLPGGSAQVRQRLQSLLADVPVQPPLPGVAEETLRELVTVRHDGCIDVLTSALGGVRIQLWLPVTAAPPPALAAPEGVGAGKRLH